MDKSKSGLPVNNQEKQLTPKDKFLEYARGILGPYLSEKIAKASGTDSIFGTISGWVKTVPTTPFEISFDTNKENLESIVYSKLKEEIDSMGIDSSTEFETLRANVSISAESEKDKPAEERHSSGGIMTLVYKK